jgi:hypothetical protein
MLMIRVPPVPSPSESADPDLAAEVDRLLGC